MIVGEVVAFDRETCCGRVRVDLEIFPFHSTSFNASTFRWPRVGERVEVVLNSHGELLALHGDIEVPR